MGYQQFGIPKGWSYRTVTFRKVGSTQHTFDLRDITPVRSDGSAFGTTFSDRCYANIYLQPLDAEGKGIYGQKYYYYSTKTGGVTDGWYAGKKTESGIKVTEPVLIRDGEGLIVYCDLTAAARLQVNGEVDLTDNTTAIPTGWSFSGNFTPVDIDIQNIVPLKTDGTPFGTTFSDRCYANIYIQPLDDEGQGIYGQKYYYYSTKTSGVTDGWYAGKKTESGTKVTDPLTFTAGKGFIVYCDLTAGARLSINKVIVPQE